MSWRADSLWPAPNRFIPAKRSHDQATLQGQIAAADRQIAAIDRQIDRLVDELCGLTEEEIRIVEGAT